MNYRSDEFDQLFSAHMDGRLSGAEEARLAAMLETDPAARQALGALRYTRQLAAETPRMPVPRAFTLNEVMPGVRSPQRAGWLAWLRPAHLRLAAAMMAVVLLVVLVGDAGMSWQAVGTTTGTALHAPSGGLDADQGDPTGILAAKTPTSEEAGLNPAGFLGLAPATLVALEVGLVLLVLLLLVASWRLSRA